MIRIQLSTRPRGLRSTIKEPEHVPAVYIRHLKKIGLIPKIKLLWLEKSGSESETEPALGYYGDG